MESVIRALAIYLFLLVLIRLSGRRTLASITPFEFVLLLIIGESTQQALLGDDFSVMTAFIVIGTLIGADIGLSELKQHVIPLGKFIDGVPVVLIEDGKQHKGRMAKARIDETDIMESAREAHGLERMEQVRYAILERTGSISVIPYPPS